MTGDLLGTYSPEPNLRLWKKNMGVITPRPTQEVVRVSEM
jgi:hypothetical protein